MVIDLNAVILDLRGEPLKMGQTILTLKEVLCAALLAPDSGEASGKEKVDRFKLAQRITDADKFEPSDEERVKFRDLTSKVYGPLVVGRLYEMLDPKQD